MSDLLSKEICNQAVMDILAATEVGKSPLRQVEEPGREEGAQEAGALEVGGQDVRGQEEHE